jgi:superfamily I DNA and/or RNA helicase
VLHNSVFYENKLQAAGCCDQLLLDARWQRLKGSAPVIFVDKRGEDLRRGNSFQNETEALCIVELIKELYDDGVISSLGRVSVIAPYRAQIACIRYVLRKAGLGYDECCATPTRTPTKRTKVAVLMLCQCYAMPRFGIAA